jgi:hypothetical protein
MLFKSRNIYELKHLKMNDIMVEKAQGKHQVEQPFVGH